MLERFKKPIAAQSLETFGHLVLGRSCTYANVIVEYRDDTDAGFAGVSLRDLVSKNSDMRGEYFFHCVTKTPERRRIMYVSPATLVFPVAQREERALEAFLIADTAARVLRQRLHTIPVDVFIGKGNKVEPPLRALWRDQAKQLGLKGYLPVDF